MVVILTELWWIVARWPKSERAWARRDLAIQAAWELGIGATAGQIRQALIKPGGKHVYLSTGCLHGDHKYCQTEARRYDGTTKTAAHCKGCEAPCVCMCHKVQAPERRVVTADEAAGLLGEPDFVDAFTNPALIGNETGERSSCGATAVGVADMTLGPCTKRERHKDWHEAADGAQWTSQCRACGRTERERCSCPPPDTVPVPAEALQLLVLVARGAALGGGWVSATTATRQAHRAKRALAALDDAGLLDQFKEEGQS